METLFPGKAGIVQQKFPVRAHQWYNVVRGSWRRLGESNTVPVRELRFIRPLLVPTSQPPANSRYSRSQHVNACLRKTISVEKLWKDEGKPQFKQESEENQI